MDSGLSPLGETHFFLFFVVTGPMGVETETIGARSVAAGDGFTVPVVVCGVSWNVFVAVPDFDGVVVERAGLRSCISGSVVPAGAGSVRATIFVAGSGADFAVVVPGFGEETVTKVVFRPCLTLTVFVDEARTVSNSA